MPGILGLYDTPSEAVQLSPVERNAVVNEVIDQINQEFAPTVLQSPGETERKQIRSAWKRWCQLLSASATCALVYRMKHRLRKN